MNQTQLHAEGDSTWCIIGIAATGFILYVAREYAHASVYQLYETEDKQRLGFQTLTMFGQPGRKVEVPRTLPKFVSPKQVTGFIEQLSIQRKTKMFNTEENEGLLKKAWRNTAGSTIPIKVEGVKNNILIDKTGTFFHDHDLLDIVSSNHEDGNKNVEKKDNRTQWQKEVYQKRKKKRS